MKWMIVSAVALSLASIATTAGAAPASPAQGVSEDMLVQVKHGRGHAKGNRGLHRGWYIGRGNKHRFRRRW